MSFDYLLLINFIHRNASQETIMHVSEGVLNLRIYPL